MEHCHGFYYYCLSVFQVEMSGSCMEAVTQMLWCPVCVGLDFDDVRPCSSYCMNVMRGCLVQHTALSGVWNTFIGTQLSPFNG